MEISLSEIVHVILPCLSTVFQKLTRKLNVRSIFYLFFFLEAALSLSSIRQKQMFNTDRKFLILKHLVAGKNKFNVPNSFIRLIGSLEKTYILSQFHSLSPESEISFFWLNETILLKNIKTSSGYFLSLNKQTNNNKKISSFRIGNKFVFELVPGWIRFSPIWKKYSSARSCSFWKTMFFVLKKWLNYKNIYTFVSPLHFRLKTDKQCCCVF